MDRLPSDDPAVPLLKQAIAALLDRQAEVTELRRWHANLVARGEADAREIAQLRAELVMKTRLK
jgi:hypothetical protein